MTGASQTVAVWRAAKVPPAAEDLVADGFPDWLARLLARRGVADKASAERFLTPSIDHLHAPSGLNGLDAAVQRLMRARTDREKVAVVGDYDVDGVSGTALLTAVLRACAIEVLPILPHRMRDGYGFQPIHAERAREAGCGLVVTVDCGTTSIDAARAAIEVGLDVVVTDHHLPGEALPAGVVLVNPHQAGSTYPFPDLSGAGLAFKLAQAVAQACERPIPTGQLLRLACLGTIADMVPLRDENRVIAAIGLAELENTKSVGLRALLSTAGVRAPLGADDVGFRIGPRLNAPGRLDSAEKSLELLLCRDPARARELAEELDRFNRDRQTEERQVVTTAREMVAARGDLPPIIVAWHPDWHRGVVGIAAGRLARELHRPTILLAEEGETATGSGRSIKGVNLHAFLDTWREQLARFGGHAQAIGMTALLDRLPALRESWEAAAVSWREQLAVKYYDYEIEVEPHQVDQRLLKDLMGLEPHGEGNPRPMVRLRGPLQLLGSPRLFGNDHLSAQVSGAQGGMLRLLGWGWAPRRDQLEGAFEALGFLERDDFRGGVMLRLVDARPMAVDDAAAVDPDPRAPGTAD